MASLFRNGSSRRKTETSAKIRIQFKNKSSKATDDDVVEDENSDNDENLPVSFGNNVSEDDSPTGTRAVKVNAEASSVKKKRDACIRTDMSVLDNVSCTACGRQLNPHKNGALQKHPELKVVICKNCENFLSSGEISKDKDGADEQCRWCGEGGRLVVCDKCSSAFCKSCVLRNFSRSEFNNINSQDNWLCYLCNKTPLQGLCENYRKIRDTLKALHEKAKMKAACPGGSSGSPFGKKSVGSKPSPNASTTLITIEDLNVSCENVHATIDKLFTSTNTFTGVLQALRSQFSQSISQQKKEQHARALYKSMETYLKSIKKILSEPLQEDESDTKQGTPKDKESTVQIHNSISEKSNSVNGDLSGEEDIISSTKTQKKTKSKEAEKDTVSENAKNNSKSTASNVKTHSTLKGTANDKNSDKAASDAIEGGDRSYKSRTNESKKESDSENETSSNHFTADKRTSKKSTRKLSEKGAISDTDSDDVDADKDLQVTNGVGLSNSSAEKEKTPSSKISDLYDDENLAAKLDLIKDIADEVLRQRKKSDEDNTNDDDVDDDDLPISFGETSKAPENDSKKSVPKRKKLEVSSDEGNEVSGKRSKPSDSLPSKKSQRKLVHDKDEKESTKKLTSDKSEDESAKIDKSGKANTKDKKDSTSVRVEDYASSSDLLMSDDEDVAISTRRQTRKSKKMSEASEKNEKGSKSKKTHKSKEPTTKFDSTEEDDVDKEIEKLSKCPTLRKRKAANKSDGEAVEEKKPAVSKVNENTKKTSKPGPKCSKKGVDYDDLSSDDNEKKDDDDTDEDEDDDEPPITFSENTDIGNKKDLSMDENEMAKKGLLEDSDSDHPADDEEYSSSDDDPDAEEETKKKTTKQKEVKEEVSDNVDEDNDSDENIGKRKKIQSKLLSAKLSESDSDVGKPKIKKKVDDDDESFKGDESSNSSSVSDLTDDDDDDSDDTEDDSDNSESKSKKKGKKNRKKQRKRKGKKGSDEDEDDEDSAGGKKKKKGKGKKRRRIKKMSNSSDEGGEEDDDDPNNSKAGKRKEIRKVMSNKKLEDSTKAAAKAEEKRRKRIAAKQREFNIETITDENNPVNCPVTTKLVLEASKEEGNEPIIQVNKKLVRKLKPHQVEAVQFLWDCLYESVKRSKKTDGAGCILAHCMGLGKTLSVIAFVHTVLTHEKLLKHRTCLVVSPLNTVLNWKNEWDMWLDEKDQLEVWELAGNKQNANRASALKDWHESGGIMIIGYEMYRNLTLGNRCKNKKQKKIFQETLVDPGPDLVICDEGHILKNEASAISKAMNLMKTKRRVVLTGTPLQNNLNEYHCMVSFVKPNLLGTRKEFNNRFISPIQNGQCTDSTQQDVKLMKARAHVLHEMLAGCVQRRDYSALTKFLPPKQEYVISVRLTNIQIELYEKYLEVSGQGVDGVFTNKGARLFTDYQNLMKIWTHPWVLKLAEIRDELKAKYDDDEDSFIDDEDTEEEKSFSSSSSSSEEEKLDLSDSAGEGTSSAKQSTQKGTRRTRAKARQQAGEDSDSEEVIVEWKSRKSRKEGEVVEVEEPDKSVTKDWWAPYVTEDDKSKLELSNKLFLLFEILRMCEEIGDKVLIFSQSILSLNIIESFLEVIDSKFQQECDNMTEEEKEQLGVFGRSWTKNLDYYRMDGTTSAQNRHAWASSFNDIENYRARLFLISTRAGGLGINLVAANRVIIFDASWNPSHDVQSIFRVYRFGQTKPCYIYRFLAQGTMEEKIYERQVTKLSLSQRVVDEHQIERHFSANDLKELYNFRPDRWDDGTEKPTLSLPKDPLLADILTTNKHCVVSFHEHDSLLENQVEQTLTEEEKKAAWEEYENEKKGINIRGPGTGSWPMMAAAQILSREQITATAQALRQQLPDISEDLFHLHLQQALKRLVQIKQEQIRRFELIKLQEINFLNAMKQQQGGQASGGQQQPNMAPWMQLQQMRAMQQNQMMMGIQPFSSTNWVGQNQNKPISNKPEEAIDLDDN